MAHDWSAPYRWTIADKDGIVPAPAGWPKVGWNYIYARRDLAEGFAHYMRANGQPDAQAVPIPYVGAS